MSDVGCRMLDDTMTRTISEISANKILFISAIMPEGTAIHLFLRPAWTCVNIESMRKKRAKTYKCFCFPGFSKLISKTRKLTWRRKGETYRTHFVQSHKGWKVKTNQIKKKTNLKFLTLILHSNEQLSIKFLQTFFPWCLVILPLLACS